MPDLGNYIIETVIKIDKMQKEARKDEIGCVSCETSLLAHAFNTIPVSFTSCCGTPYTSNLDFEGNTTQFFRIEAVRDQKYVTLRLLEVCEDEQHVHYLAETNFTCILDLTCVCLMQCYEAINIANC